MWCWGLAVWLVWHSHTHTLRQMGLVTTLYTTSPWWMQLLKHLWCNGWISERPLILPRAAHKVSWDLEGCPAVGGPWYTLVLSSTNADLVVCRYSAATSRLIWSTAYIALLCPSMAAPLKIAVRSCGKYCILWFNGQSKLLVPDSGIRTGNIVSHARPLTLTRVWWPLHTKLVLFECTHEANQWLAS